MVTKADIKALDLGYLTGADIMQYCPVAVLISQYEIDNDCISNAAVIAYTEINAHIGNRYDIISEYQKTGTDRNTFVIKLTAIAAVREVLANATQVSDVVKQNITWLNEALKGIREGQIIVAGVNITAEATRSYA